VTTPPDPPPDDTVAGAVERYLEAKAKGQGTGNYRSLAASALGRWQDWLADQDITLLEDVTDEEMRRYAQSLRRAVRDGGLAASTAQTYYATSRACLAWCVQDGRYNLVENPAAASRATSELPEDTAEPDRQFWRPEDVQTIRAYVGRRAHDAVEEHGLQGARPALRDRALVSLLAAAGVRGAEVFRDTDDDRDGRQGLPWRRVDLDAGTLTVLGKSQNWEHAQLPEQACDRLRRYYEAQDPPNRGWPVFPTAHGPSKYRAVREQLSDRDWDEEEIEDVLEENPIGEVLREHDVVPPAITVRGARSVMQRLCDEADLDVEGGYLKPHGARRGLGDALYRESAELAQSALRHASVRTTHDAYSHIDASETADEVGDVLDDTWGETPTEDPES